jgi:hypothetical protein
VFDRNGKGHQLNNYSWPQFVSTFKPPDGSQLADGTYRPSLAPVNIADTTMGAKYVTPWYQGPLSPQKNRGQTQSAIYLDNPNHHEENVSYAQIASFAPFAGPNPGVTVATSSTVYGADLLVAGMTPGGQEVRKYTLERPASDAKTVAPKQIANLPVIPGLAAAAPLGGRKGSGEVPEHPGAEVEHHGPERQCGDGDADPSPVVLGRRNIRGRP